MLSLFERLRKLSQKRRYAGYRHCYQLAETFRFNGDGIELYGDGAIIIGDHSYLGRFSSIQAVKGCSVSIGKHCAISHYVKIYTSTYLVDQDFINSARRARTGSVIIGDGVWIGANALLNPGIVIGDNSIIGANSVVTRNVDANSIVSGIPATLVRMKKNE